jgi:alkyl sulfatase BDS1-like metallo-beta-lactamase superfamily hydrolase
MHPARDGSPKDATATTHAANASVLAELPFGDRRDFERANRGLIAGPASQQILNEGWPVWDFSSWDFLDGECPPSVNPSLWRQGQLNRVAGLFEVVGGIYQVRGFDLSNVTFVAGDTGWIVIDPLTTAETAAAALALVSAELGERPIHAVIYTHSHVDHFGGVRGVIDEADVAGGRVAVLAPDGFLEAAIAENVVAGNVMTRRATYMYGPLLPRNATGHVDAGLGKTAPLGTTGLIAPTDVITATGTERVIDGVRIVFQNTPGTEAPAEMNFFFPDRRALCMAENCTGVLHNLYTPRGAQVRDALAWSKYIDEAIVLFGADTDVVFASHHWPRWGADDALEFLAKQRDLYRYLHDQAMRLANHGLTMTEIAEELRLPDELATEFYNRDYYGTVNHDAKAVYQRYLGWFDGNPAHLHPLPPAEAARRYVEFMGGSTEVLSRAEASFAAGDYRWVAEVVNHVVFAEPDNEAARHLQADALEQLGYQAESGPWRSFYLTAAQELRQGVPSSVGAISTASPDVVRAITPEMLFDYLGVRLNGDRAAGATLTIGFELTDTGEDYTLFLENGALHVRRGLNGGDQAATARLGKFALAQLVLGRIALDDDAIAITGDREAVATLFSLLDTFEFWFPIVTP